MSHCKYITHLHHVCEMQFCIRKQSEKYACYETRNGNENGMNLNETKQNDSYVLSTRVSQHLNTGIKNTRLFTLVLTLTIHQVSCVQVAS